MRLPDVESGSLPVRRGTALLPLRRFYFAANPLAFADERARLFERQFLQEAIRARFLLLPLAERPDVERNEARILDQLRHFAFHPGIVAGIKDDQSLAGSLAQRLVAQRIERLDHFGAFEFAGDFLAG